MKMKILVAIPSANSLADVEVALEALAKKEKLELELAVSVDGQLAYNMFMEDLASEWAKDKPGRSIEGVPMYKKFMEHLNTKVAKVKGMSGYSLVIIGNGLPQISACVLARTISELDGPPIIHYTDAEPDADSPCNIGEYVDAQVVREGSDTTVLIETVSKLVQH
jgi:hypothetical protein